ncbi:MAG: hypothetical protein A07HB70_00835 [uncultured archaeon A07HB70]|nr:MAG: hypothetical protein A07HB70_00835 [uncultured archaeon A07HB70]
MKRRRVLATLGTAAFGSMAGCAGETDRGSDESTLTDETTAPPPPTIEPKRRGTGESARVADGVFLTIADPSVRSSVVVYNSPVLSVQGAGVQFVVVSVEGDTDFEPSSFVLERDGAIQSPPPQQTQQHVGGVARECDGRCLGIPVEAEAAESAGIAYRPDDQVLAVWGLDDSTVAAFPNVPDLRLQSAIITEQEGDVAVELSVENVGERDGVFLFIIAPAWVADAGEPFGFRVPRGETVTETVVPNDIQSLDPDEAGFSTEPTADSRYFRIGTES